MKYFNEIDLIIFFFTFCRHRK